MWCVVCVCVRCRARTPAATRAFVCFGVRHIFALLAFLLPHAEDAFQDITQMGTKFKALTGASEEAGKLLGWLEGGVFGECPHLRAT